MEGFPTLPPSKLTVSGKLPWSKRPIGEQSDPKPISSSTARSRGPRVGFMPAPRRRGRPRRSCPWADTASFSLSWTYSTTGSCRPRRALFRRFSRPERTDVFVIPTGSADAGGAVAGAISLPLDIQPAPAGYPPVAAGKNLIAAPLGTIRGLATIADGRPLVGATIEAHAAASARGHARSSPMAARRMSGTTDANGAFSLSVDPGVFDVVVKPADGTGFPWVTATSVTPAAGDPSGARARSARHRGPGARAGRSDPQGREERPSRLRARARVRPFPVGAMPAVPGTPPIELGSWLTDATGHLTMFIAPPN